MKKTQQNNVDKKKKNETLNRKFINVKLNNKNIRMQLDTGSDISIIDTELLVKNCRGCAKPFNTNKI